jgi:hypothetical protein
MPTRKQCSKQAVIKEAQTKKAIIKQPVYSSTNKQINSTSSLVPLGTSSQLVKEQRSSIIAKQRQASEIGTTSLPSF